MRRTSLLLAACTLLAAGCAGVPDPASTPPTPAEGAGAASTTGADSPITPFSAIADLSARSEWVAWTFHPTKRATRYRIVNLSGQRVVQADADRSVSGLMHRLDVDPTARPMLHWRWRVDTPVPGGDVGARHADDASARIVLAFDGDKDRLPLKEQMFFERAKLLAGQELPYATLMYVWDSTRPAGTVTPNAHTSRVRKIVVQNGAQGTGQWHAHTRDIVADYERAFGKKPPGRLIAVGVLTDSDNTKQRARAWYGDIRLTPRAD